jgi:hypothetical protein
LNDNTDYLRMIHNKRYARLVWLLADAGKIEPGLDALSKSVPTETNVSEGLCLLEGRILGPQVSWDDEPTDFNQFVTAWSESLGSSWCKLTVLDLIELCGGTLSQTPVLQRLGFSDGTRQDWNTVLERDMAQFGLQEQVPFYPYPIFSSSNPKTNGLTV